MSYRLEGAERRELREILQSAFDRQSLARALAESTPSRDFEDIVSKGPFSDELFQMIDRAEREGWLDQLERLLLETVPARTDLIARTRTIVSQARTRAEQDASQPIAGAVRRVWNAWWIAGGIAATAAVALGVYLIREDSNPNFIVKVVDGSPAAPVAEQTVFVGLASTEGVASDRVDRKTNQNGEAFFRVTLGSDRIYLGGVEVVTSSSSRHCQFPAFVVAEIRSITHNLQDLSCLTGPSAARTLSGVRVASRTTVLPAPTTTDWMSRVPVDTTARSSRSPFGLPTAPVVLDRLYYSLGYDPSFRAPRWLAFTVDTQRTILLPRQGEVFRPDPDIPLELQSDRADYVGNPYDRGHLVWRADALWGDRGEEWARQAEREVYYYSTMVPQAEKTNQVTWLEIERFTAGASAKLGPIYVVAGPIYPPAAEGNMPFLVLGPGKTPVPTALFRVLLRKTADGTWRSLAFVVPNDGSIEPNPRAFAAPVTRVEREAGLVFFPNIPAADAGPLKANSDVARFLAN